MAGTEAGLRTFRVDRVSSVEPTGEPAVRPEGFDLAEAWRPIADEVDEQRAPFRARALVVADFLSAGPGHLRANVCRSLGDAPDGRVEVDVGGPDAWILAAELAGYGSKPGGPLASRRARQRLAESSQPS